MRTGCQSIKINLFSLIMFQHGNSFTNGYIFNGLGCIRMHIPTRTLMNLPTRHTTRTRTPESMILTPLLKSIIPHISSKKFLLETLQYFPYPLSAAESIVVGTHASLSGSYCAIIRPKIKHYTTVTKC